jgi:hypothetical protein
MKQSTEEALIYALRSEQAAREEVIKLKTQLETENKTTAEQLIQLIKPSFSFPRNTIVDIAQNAIISLINSSCDGAEEHKQNAGLVLTRTKNVETILSSYRDKIIEWTTEKGLEQHEPTIP